MSLAKDLQPIDWLPIEDVIYGWLTGAVPELGTIVEHAVWEDQNVPQPPYPYASMKITAYAKEGGLDENRVSELIGAPAGKEIEFLSLNTIAMTLSLSFHVDRSAGANIPGSRGMSLAAKAQASLGMQVVQDYLRTAGIAIIQELGINDTSLVINGEWLSRATMDVRMRVTTNMTWETGYIAHVQVESPPLDVDVIIDL
jgi:hypothetical protein